jgi:hypothetical protein
VEIKHIGESVASLFPWLDFVLGAYEWAGIEPAEFGG